MKPTSLPPSYASLTTDAYRPLEHAASLKAFLKAFKSNRELEHLAQVAKVVEAQLRQLMAGVTQQLGHPPYSLLDLQLVRQNTSAGSTFLRWRTRDFSRMGVSVWERQMNSAHLPMAIREALYHVECDRITLNLQMSVTHSLYRQATSCTTKMASAERVLRQFTSPLEE